MAKWIDFKDFDDTWGPKAYSSCSAFDSDTWWGGEDCSASEAVHAREEWDAVQLKVVKESYLLFVATSACFSVMIISLGAYSHKPYIRRASCHLSLYYCMPRATAPTTLIPTLVLLTVIATRISSQHATLLHRPPALLIRRRGWRSPVPSSDDSSAETELVPLNEAI